MRDREIGIWIFVGACQALYDAFGPHNVEFLPELKAILRNGNYLQVFGLLQFVIRHGNSPYEFADAIAWILQNQRAAYRVLEKTIVPIGSDAELETIKRAFADVAATEFHGARAHLRNAASELTAGNYSSSIRESIHAVESVARLLDERSADLSEALARLEAKASVHKAMKKGFLALYGYTSDQEGIRHALIEAGAPMADETDALFMMGACGSFVSYLINKARNSGLLPKGK